MKRLVADDMFLSGDHDEQTVWIRDCIPAIDESNRVLKKQLIAWYKKNHNSTENAPGPTTPPIMTRTPTSRHAPSTTTTTTTSTNSSTGHILQHQHMRATPMQATHNNNNNNTYGTSMLDDQEFDELDDF